MSRMVKWLAAPALALMFSPDLGSAAEATRGRHTLPLIALDPRSPVLPLLVEYALKTYGLA